MLRCRLRGGHRPSSPRPDHCCLRENTATPQAPQVPLRRRGPTGTPRPSCDPSGPLTSLQIADGDARASGPPGEGAGGLGPSGVAEPGPLRAAVSTRADRPQLCCPSQSPKTRGRTPGVKQKVPAARPAWRTSRTGARMPAGRRQRTRRWRRPAPAASSRPEGRAQMSAPQRPRNRSPSPSS